MNLGIKNLFIPFYSNRLRINIINTFIYLCIPFTLKHLINSYLAHSISYLTLITKLTLITLQYISTFVQDTFTIFLITEIFKQTPEHLRQERRAQRKTFARTKSDSRPGSPHYPVMTVSHSHKIQ